MPSIEKSYGVQLELKDLDTSKRTAVIRHAVYTSVDKVKDISSKGMFTKSWSEGMPDFLFNHVAGNTPGPTLRTFDDEAGAYTEVKFGNWTLGNDVMEMADAGVLKGASYGYVTKKSHNVEVKGQKVRKLTEVQHVETSLLTVLPAHPEAGIITLNKAFDFLEIKTLTDNEQNILKTVLAGDMGNLQTLIQLAGALDTNSDLYGWIMYYISRRADSASSIMDQLRWNQSQINGMKNCVTEIDTYCRKAKASDETIQLLSQQANEYKNIISQYDTAITQVATEPNASDDEVKGILTNYLTSLNLQSWTLKSN